MVAAAGWGGKLASFAWPRKVAFAEGGGGWWAMDGHLCLLLWADSANIMLRISSRKRMALAIKVLALPAS